MSERIAYHHLNADGCRTGDDDIQCLREYSVADKEFFGIVFYFVLAPVAVKHKHSFGSGSGFIQQRRIGNGHGGKIHHHGLKIEDGFAVLVQFQPGMACRPYQPGFSSTLR